MAKVIDSGKYQNAWAELFQRIIENPLEFASLQQACLLRETAGRFRQMLPYGVSRARPLARRELSTLRPLRVAIRARNPWVRARFSTLGWKVRFMGETLFKSRDQRAGQSNGLWPDGQGE